MKKVIGILLALSLCIGILFCVPALNGSANSTLDLPDNAKVLADKIGNLLIDFIHHNLMLIRHPWVEKKSVHCLDLSEFTLVFSDEFDGDSLSKVWTHTRQGTRKGGYWNKNQTRVEDGNLIIQTDYREDGPYGAGYYCDRIDTRKKYLQTYGYFECRCILPAAQGLWGAFWLSSENASVDGTPGTEGTEIDVFESPLFYRGKLGLSNNMITSNLHWGGYGLQTHYRNVTIAKVNNPYTEYNTYGVEWNEKEYIFYINGVETGRSSAGGVSRVPEYLLLSIEIDGVDGKPFHGWSGIITANEEGAVPAQLKVDYVRAYQYTNLCVENEQEQSNGLPHQSA